MLNVSCQKQNHCSSDPADSLTESSMEFVGQSRLSRACNLLEVPGLSSADFDDDEGDVVIGITPKSSPLPRRKSSVTDDDSEPDPPLCGSRRVSFADAKGLSLVQVKEFVTWDVPKLPGYDSSESEVKEVMEYYLSPITFSLPLPTEELFVKVRDQKVELESLELLSGTTILKGVIRVLNISFSKAVYVRTTFDAWSSHFDLLAEYISGSSDGLMECFSFILTLAPPHGEQGIRVDLCVRYDTPVGTFWANNNHRNYVLFCHQKVKDRPQKDNGNKKGCLKTVSQNYSSEENISGLDASSQENISADESKLNEEVNSVKAKQISDGQSKIEGEQKLETENRPFISRRSARKAARLAQLRDHFPLKSKESNDTESDETSRETKQQAAQEENPQEEHSNVPSFSEENSKAEMSSFVFNSMATCCESIVDVLHDCLQANHNTACNESEKCESKKMADLATGGVSVTHNPDNPLPLNDKPAHVDCQHVNKSVPRAEEESQTQSTCYGPANNNAPDPVYSVVSAEISENSVGQNNSFTFGTVVAPLYHQMFGREGSESQSTAEWGSPIWARLNASDWRKRSCCSGSTNVGNDDVPGYVTISQELNPNVEEERSDIVMADDILDPPAQIIISDHRLANTPKHPIILSGDKEVHQHCVNLLLPTHLQGESQEESKPCDMHNQTTAERRIETNINETVSETESHQVVSTRGNSSLPLQQEHVSNETQQQIKSGGENDYKCVNESNSDADIGKNYPESTTNAFPKVDSLLEALYDLNSDQIHNSDRDEAANLKSELSDTEKFSTFGSCQETSKVEEQNNNSYEDESKNSAETSEASDEADKLLTQVKVTCDEDMFLKDEELLIDDSRTVVLKQEDITLADTTNAKQWKMVDEEKIILLGHEKNEATGSDTEAHQGGQLEDTVVGSTLGKMITTQKEKTHTEMCEELTAAGVNRSMTEDALGLEDKKQVEVEEMLEAVAGIDEEDFDLGYVQATQTAKAGRGEEQVGEVYVENRVDREKRGVDKGEYCVEMQEVTVSQTSVREINNFEMEEEIKPGEEKTEDDNLNYNEAGDSQDVNAEPGGITTDDRGDELECFERSLDILQNNGEDALSAPMNSVQKKRVTGRDMEEVNAHIPLEINLYKEEDYQSSKDVTHGRSEGDLCYLTDEPESDQTNQNSASSDSDSDDEVELYMHCLKAVHTGAQATKDNNTAFSVGKRASISRRKSLPMPMPSISECLDEEPHISCFQDNHGDMNPTEIQPCSAVPSVSSGQEIHNSSVSWWKETFSCSNILKTLLYTTLLVVFLVVAYHYDFLACLVLYLISVVWLYCQREQQPTKNNGKMD